MSYNQEYLYKLARRLSNNPDVIEDLVQEGTIAILDAAGSYNFAQGVMFLTYATPFIRKAMRSFMAIHFSRVSLKTRNTLLPLIIQRSFLENCTAISQ